jgi:hypothetical protein
LLLSVLGVVAAALEVLSVAAVVDWLEVLGALVAAAELSVEVLGVVFAAAVLSEVLGVAAAVEVLGVLGAGAC